MKANIAIAAALVAVLACGCAPAVPTHADGSGSGSASAPVAAPEAEPEPVVDLAEAEVTVEDQTYTGLALTPEVTVELEGETLTEDEDYSLEYEDNTEIGTATVTVTAEGDFEGSTTATFEIGPHEEGWDNIEGYYLYYTDESVIATNRFVPGTDGTWFYVGKYGTTVASRWVSSGSGYYYVGSDGRPVADAWVNDNGTYYYLDSAGHPVTSGWVYDEGAYYYLDAAGRLVSDAWVSDSGATYYCGSDGAMLTGLQTIDGEAYIFNADGSLRYISGSDRLDRIVCRIIRDYTGFDARSAYNYVIDSFAYVKSAIDTGYVGWEESYALHLIDTGGGDCYAFSSLYGFLLRAIGYDMKIIDGVVSNRNNGKYYRHCWVEVYMDGGTYVCDPLIESPNGYGIPSYFITYAENAGVTTWLRYELDWNGYPELSPQ